MPELEQKQFQKRQVAYKVKVSDVLGNILLSDDISLGYIKVNGLSVSRVNIIANLVYKSEESSGTSSAIIDDGSGRILLRSFENKGIFSTVDVGDVVLMIGRIREFSKEKYIAPEILKKIDIGWMIVRKRELERLPNPNLAAENKMDSPIKEVVANVNEEIYLLIKDLDSGDGVSIEEVIKKSNKDYAEGIIKSLLENGDIFEVRPGRLKVLE